MYHQSPARQLVTNHRVNNLRGERLTVSMREDLAVRNGQVLPINLSSGPFPSRGGHVPRELPGERPFGTQNLVVARNGGVVPYIRDGAPMPDHLRRMESRGGTMEQPGRLCQDGGNCAELPTVLPGCGPPPPLVGQQNRAGAPPGNVRTELRYVPSTGVGLPPLPRLQAATSMAPSMPPSQLQIHQWASTGQQRFPYTSTFRVEGELIFPNANIMEELHIPEPTCYSPLFSEVHDQQLLDDNMIVSIYRAFLVAKAVGRDMLFYVCCSLTELTIFESDYYDKVTVWAPGSDFLRAEQITAHVAKSGDVRNIHSVLGTRDGFGGLPVVLALNSVLNQRRLYRNLHGSTLRMLEDRGVYPTEVFLHDPDTPFLCLAINYKFILDPKNSHVLGSYLNIRTTKPSEDTRQKMFDPDFGREMVPLETHLKIIRKFTREEEREKQVVTEEKKKKEKTRKTKRNIKRDIIEHLARESVEWCISRAEPEPTAPDFVINEGHQSTGMDVDSQEEAQPRDEVEISGNEEVSEVENIVSEPDLPPELDVNEAPGQETGEEEIPDLPTPVRTLATSVSTPSTPAATPTPSTSGEPSQDDKLKQGNCVPKAQITFGPDVERDVVCLDSDGPVNVESSATDDLDLDDEETDMALRDLLDKDQEKMTRCKVMLEVQEAKQLRACPETTNNRRKRNPPRRLKKKSD